MGKMHEGDNFQKLTQIYADGEQLIEAQDWEAAITKFNEGLAIDDQFRQRYITMYAQRAFCEHQLGQWHEAINDYTMALEMEAELNHAQYYFQRGMARINLEGQDEAAVGDFTKSIALHQDHPGPFHLRGRIFINSMEKYQEGIADMDRFLSMREHPEGFQLRGYARLQLDDPEGALADLERASEMAPDAYKDYLRACCCALLEREDEMYELIAETLAADASYRDYFESDAEFEPYRKAARFVEALKS